MTHLKKTIGANGLQIVGKQSITRVSRVLGAQEHVFLFEIRRSGNQGIGISHQGIGNSLIPNDHSLIPVEYD